MLIRTEVSADLAGVHNIHESAFPTPAEARLVERLREEAAPLVSLVAEVNRVVVGHILLSPVTADEQVKLKLMGLAPLAVRPECQGLGIGSALVRGGIEACRISGAGALVVLGAPDYYSRFGFTCAADFGICCEFDVSVESFMCLELRPGYLRGTSGCVRYHRAFQDL